jgi:hypothetical protein
MNKFVAKVFLEGGIKVELVSDYSKADSIITRDGKVKSITTFDRVVQDLNLCGNDPSYKYFKRIFEYLAEKEKNDVILENISFSKELLPNIAKEFGVKPRSIEGCLFKLIKNKTNGETTVKKYIIEKCKILKEN